MALRISEIFYSVQGEGALLGIPSIFIRTSGCNLRCRWCDTPYASWNPEGETLTHPQIWEKITPFPSRHLILTGGEPMIARGIREFAAEARQRGYHITIETAGTIAPEGIACDLASLSPKLAHSTPRPDELDEAWRQRHEKLRWQPDIVRQWMEQGDYQLKFVIAHPDDLREMQTMLTECGNPPPHRVMLMPEGIDADILNQRMIWLSGICTQFGYRLSPRLHIHLYGNRRGT